MNTINAGVMTERELLDLGLRPSRIADIYSMFERFVYENKLPGVGWLIARRGKIAACQSVGYASHEDARAFRPDSLFGLWSMTKPIIAAAVLQLQERGALHVHEPIAQYLGCFRDIEVATDDQGGRRVPHIAPTILHLLTHTSGIGYGEEGEPNGDGRQLRELGYDSVVELRDTELKRVVENVASVPLAFEPGSEFLYGLNYDILGHLIEVVTGLSLEEHLATSLFEPLEMRDTFFECPPAKAGRLAHTYRRGTVDRVPHPDYTLPTRAPSGGAGLVSSLQDYWKFLDCLLQGGNTKTGHSVLGRRTTEVLLKGHDPTGALKEFPFGGGGMDSQWTRGFGVGLGMSPVVDTRKTLYGREGDVHWGGHTGTWFSLVPDEQLVGIVASQAVPARVDGAEYYFTDMLYSALL